MVTTIKVDGKTYTCNGDYVYFGKKGWAVYDPFNEVVVADDLGDREWAEIVSAEYFFKIIDRLVK